MRFLDAPIAVLALGEGTGGKGSTRREVEGRGWVDGRGLGTDITCEVTTRSSARSIAAGADGPLVDISVDAGAKASPVEWWKSGSMADSPLLGCALTGSTRAGERITRGVIKSSKNRT
jgi:hypothetical protein